MKAVKVIYWIMSIVMILTIFVFAIIGFLQYGTWYDIPVAVSSVVLIGLSVYLQSKSSGEAKKLITVMISAHIMTILAVLQIVLANRVQITTSIFILLIAIIMIGIMLFSFLYIFKKLDVFKTDES